MKRPDQNDDVTYFDGIALDHETMRRLMEVAEMSHTEPKVLIASIVHDVMHDDELAHGPSVPSCETDLTKH